MTAPDWDDDSPQLRENLGRMLARLVEQATSHVAPRVELAKQWHSTAMAGPDADGVPSLIGKFRGEPGLERVGVRIGGVDGVMPWDVAAALRQFETTLRRAVAWLDRRYPADADLDRDGIQAAIDLAAWAHSEWVRIHPFANGNGRNARAWANFVLARYGIPPVIALRPRPDGGYEAAAEMAMQSDWTPTAAVFASIIEEATALATARAHKRPAGRTPESAPPGKKGS
jgi:Fic/DOC family